MREIFITNSFITLKGKKSVTSFYNKIRKNIKKEDFYAEKLIALGICKLIIITTILIIKITNSLGILLLKMIGNAFVHIIELIPLVFYCPTSISISTGIKF